MSEWLSERITEQSEWPIQGLNEWNVCSVAVPTSPGNTSQVKDSSFLEEPKFSVMNWSL